MKLSVNYLEGCGYSQNAKILLENNNIPFELNSIQWNDRHSYKNIHPTFPQIFIEKINKKVLIGGYDNLKTILDLIEKQNKKFNLQEIYHMADKLNIPQKPFLNLIYYLKSNI